MKNNSFTDLIIDGFKKAAVELEELRVQMTLGSYEARDLYEQIKKDLHARLHEAGQALHEFKNKEEVKRVIQSIEELRVQLNLGIAETEEAFEAQKKKLSHALAVVEAQVKGDPEFKKVYGEVRMQLEKFRVKLELLSLQFKLKKLKTEYNWEGKKEAFNKELEKFQVKLNEMEKETKDRMQHFQGEMEQAFSHFRKSFQFKQEK